ncbi:hypothetical protein [Sphingomonas xanthus]|uniref:Lipoprotein n=1 Tax=Sphingomonas xanthus TaxID=2594473 RepID=A0A516IRH7_9SPHN|nr:hypothetical protein [Sphingomonas xanthus]QDP19498.1 hypothetical protein FMM02_05685 [Sphingomonas xanthus]
MRSLAAIALLTAGCAYQPVSIAPADRFMAALGAHCGKAYEGKLVSNEAADADFFGKRMVMHVRQCSAKEIRIPFHVENDRSRTWVVTRTAYGVRLKHDHRHEDGHPDALTNYGGDSRDPGTAVRQEFPADAESIALFTAQGRSVSNSNVWAIEVSNRTFAYELRRPPGPGQRYFRVEFDLTRPVAPPPPPWGS